MPTATFGTWSRLSVKAAGENPNVSTPVLHHLLTCTNFGAATASFYPDLPSHLFFQGVPDDSVFFRSLQRTELVWSSQPQLSAASWRKFLECRAAVF